MNRTLLSIVAVILVSAALSAQDQMPMRGPAAERIEQFKKIRLMEELKLDEATSIKFFARYNNHQEELRKLNQKRNEIIDELQSLRRREASDAEYGKTLRELKALADPAVELRVKFFDEISEVLSAKQVAEYVIFERNFVQNLREIMREMQQQRRGGGRMR
jgi:Skp family chaperone for outer membrane proteins